MPAFVVTPFDNARNRADEIARLVRRIGEPVDLCELTANALLVDRTSEYCDREGYLADPAIWNWNVAQSIAFREGMGEFTGRECSIVRYARRYHERYGTSPLPARIARDLGCSRRLLCRWAPEALLKVAGFPNRPPQWDGRPLTD